MFTISVKALFHFLDLASLRSSVKELAIPWISYSHAASSLKMDWPLMVANTHTAKIIKLTFIFVSI
jgi:hypothetical protein